mmetsp:Transcript_3328/g.7852  ORF Transcript_3328/g.7852 Transcript_3328/m.7852 type:complete len:258 (-) Transcript_3328:1098-1871(-)
MSLISHSLASESVPRTPSRLSSQLGRCDLSHGPSSCGGLHGGEEEHFLDVVRVRHEHHQAVDAEAPSAGRRQPVLEGRQEPLVLEHGLVVALGLVLGLVLEALALHEGVVELRVRVAQLLAADKELEALSEPWLRPVVLGQRRHDLRVIAEEGRRDKGRLQVLSHQLVDEAGGGARRRAQDLSQLLLLDGAEVVEELAALLARVVRRDLDPHHLLEAGDHGDALEGRREVHLVHALRPGAVGVVLHLVLAVELHDEA